MSTLKILKAIFLVFLVNVHVYAVERFDANSQPEAYLPAISLSTYNLINGAKGYRTWYENGAWQGDLIEHSIANDGTISTTIDLSEVTPTNSGANWSARLQFANAESVNSLYWSATRKIITAKNNTQIPFRWTNLNATQQEALDAVAYNNSENSSVILDFIRGDRVNETPNGDLRQRHSLLGDIMHSNPVYVGIPNSDIYELSYIAFKNANLYRSPRVYVGGNDGMLHVFDADTGNEIYAFVPPSLLSKLKKLSDVPYLHEYYVDGQLAVYDVFFDDDWHTILVGGLGAGGSAQFALDITDPNLSTESSTNAANKKVLWINDDDNDIGDTYGKASIVKLNDDKYYSISGNGYNSITGIAQLILTEIETGDITKISTLSGSAGSPNGLSSPSLINLDGDDTYDVAYAGDLEGNLWKFDLKTRKLAYGEPLYAAGNTQPITTKPTVTRHSYGGKMIYVATGRALVPADMSDTSIQAIYGIRDAGAVPETHNLLEQTLSGDSQVSGSTVRTLSDNSIDWYSHTGWKIELPAGMRGITDHQLRGGRLQMVITNPIDKSNWIIEADYLTGSRPNEVVFDINADGVLDTEDNITNEGGTTSVVSMWQLTEGLMSSPTIARLEDGVDVQFINSASLPDVPPPCTSGCGFVGGHIDVDTDAPETAGNGFSDTTTAHTHEYDKKVLQPYVDYFQVNQGDAKQLQLDEVVINKDKKFFVILANADLSSKSTLIIGNKKYNAVEYQKLIHKKLSTWDGGLNTLKDDDGDSLIVSINDIQLEGGTLRNSFDSHAILDGGLHPTQTSCVKDSLQITNGRWRNGALITQVIDATVVTSLDKLFLQSPTDLNSTVDIGHTDISLTELVEGELVTYGGLIAKGSDKSDAPSNGMLYESSLFWHYGDIAKLKGDPKVCYGDPGWETGVASERAGLTESQFEDVLSDAGFNSIEEAQALYGAAVTACENAADLKSCQEQTKIDGVKVKDIIKKAGKVIDFYNSVDRSNDSDNGGVNSTSGEPVVVGSNVESTGISAGPFYQKGRRAWTDITKQ